MIYQNINKNQGKKVKLDFDYWREQKKLTIRQSAELIFGVNPVDEVSKRLFEPEIETFRNRLTNRVRSDIHDAREVRASGKQGIFDDGFYVIDLFEQACSETDIYFFRSLTDIILQSPIEHLETLLETFELDVRELKRWLYTNHIIPEFFFPDDFDERLVLKVNSGASKLIEHFPDQKRREIVLNELIKERGIDELKNLRRIDVWNLLTERNSRLFGPRESGTDGIVKDFFDNQTLLSFKRGRKRAQNE